MSLCQGNHYQFDTIRRAKHSSAMVLYHLHNPDAPAFASTCNNCSMEIEAGQGFRCVQCTDFDLCANCKHSGLVVHAHPLVVGTLLLMSMYFASIGWLHHHVCSCLSSRSCSVSICTSCSLWHRCMLLQYMCSCFTWHASCCVRDGTAATCL